MQNIENKVVIITGASSGLGAETARHLVQAWGKSHLGGAPSRSFACPCR